MDSVGWMLRTHTRLTAQGQSPPGLIDQAADWFIDRRPQ